ncbi:MerR family transcriptional regulator [Citricoccus muralis]|uniref:MerR family transcriptional regulator n=1 Tax=Citricoccus muralis TaxID=169134 RepID=A0ABY8H883_9MICC|nr:MerR family transcriptional regulator [Citricoccus muralis]WFP16863.1 MerR family transcriptional regulator [Citricoccus muralis]
MDMKMAELAQRSGLSVATIKYYLREGLLAPGRRTSVNQAVYDDAHLERLRLIRALAKIAGLPLQTIRAVIDSVDGQSSVLHAMAVTQDALVGDVEEEEPVSDEGRLEALTEAERVLDETIRARGWECEPGSPAHRAAVRAVAQLHEEGLTALVGRLDDYAQAADAVGRTDLEAVTGAASLEETIRGVVLGSVMRRPMLDALVLLAQQHYARQHATI